MHIYMQDISSARYRYCLTIFNLSRESYNVELLKVLFTRNNIFFIIEEHKIDSRGREKKRERERGKKELHQLAKLAR